MKRLIKPVILFSFAAMLMGVFSAGQALAQARDPIDSIVAIVDESVILQSELDSAIDTIVVQFQGRGERLPPRSVLEEQVLERLIMTRLQVQRAEATGIRISDQEVDQSLAVVAQQNNLTLEQLRSAIESDGIEFNEFREDIRQELIASRLRQRIVDSMDSITETEVDIMLASETFDGDEYDLSQILIRVPESPTPDDLQAASDRIGELLEEIQDGLDFSEAAIQYSESSDALEGGRVGWRNLNALPRQIADNIRDLQVGEVSEPFRAGGGILLVKVNDRRPRSDIIVTEYQARHLMVMPSELLPAEQAEALINELHDRIQQGEDFAVLAREYSDDTRSANLGGMLEWFPEGAYGQAVQQQIAQLQPGELSQPFRSNQGWHLIQFEDRRQADRTEEALRAEARELIAQQKSQAEIDRVLRQFRDEAYVDIRI
ncbi:MAG: peptidylprolyl isomerase [Pseudomonadota bacterium]